METLISPATLAETLDIAVQTIYNRISTGGNLPPFLKLGRLVRFKISDVEKWLAKQEKIQSPAPLPCQTHRRRGRPTKAEQIAARQC